jgi:hypothetical protein
MRKSPQYLQKEYEDAIQRNASLFRTIGLISASGLVFLIIVHALFRQFDPAYPWLSMVIVNLVSFAGVILSLRLQLRGPFNRALGVYISAVALSLAANLYFMGGPRSPLTKAFIVIVLIAGLLGKRRIAVWLFALIVVVIISQFALSVIGLIPPPAVRNTTLVILDNLVLVIVLIVTLVLTTRVVRNNEVVETILKQRDEELTTAVQTAETALHTEQQARQRERLLIEQLQMLVQTYVTYLGHIGAGDYEAQLTIPEQKFADVPELIHLGHSLRQTISNLTTRIKDAEMAQTMYIQRSWESFLEQSTTPSGFEYKQQNSDVIATENAWMPVMETAFNSESIVTADDEMGIAMNIRGAVIGALGLKRKEHSTWTEDEILMVRDIVDQLTQTLERLRLIDDISRSAALESTASNVTASIRAEVDIEAVLERAIAELGVALQADSGYGQLSLDGDREDTE